MNLRNQESSSSHRIYSLLDFAARMKILPLSFSPPSFVPDSKAGVIRFEFCKLDWPALGPGATANFITGRTNDRHDDETKILLPASVRSDRANDGGNNCLQ